MTRTRYQLSDVGGALSWSSLRSFLTNIGGDSALARDLNKSTGWEDTLRTNAILADIYDLLQVIHADICALGGAKKKKITPYPRPGAEEKNKRIGSGAIPANKLREWIKERQAHGRRSAH